jgi:hypothetical protein
MGHEVTIWTEKPEDAERLFNLVVDWMPRDEADNCTVSCHPESSWQPIETLPKLRVHDRPVLFASFPGGVFPHGLYALGTRIPRDEFTMMNGDYYPPTHWMPLPEPPESIPATKAQRKAA